MPDKDGFDLIAELDDPGLRTKEVFARFGLTAYKAQLFDHDLVNVLMIADSSESPMTSNEYDDAIDALFTKTTGRLLGTAKADGRLDDRDLDLCRAAVEERNRLIHHFYRHHAEDFITARGQQRMLDDLTTIADILDRATAACEESVLRFGAPIGITEDRITAMYARMKRDTEARDAAENQTDPDQTYRGGG